MIYGHVGGAGDPDDDFDNFDDDDDLPPRAGNGGGDLSNRRGRGGPANPPGGLLPEDLRAMFRELREHMESQQRAYFELIEGLQRGCLDNFVAATGVQMGPSECGN